MAKVNVSKMSLKALKKRYSDPFVSEFERARFDAGRSLWKALRASRMGEGRFAKRMGMSPWRCSKFLAGDCDQTLERLAEAASVLKRELRVTFPAAKAPRRGGRRHGGPYNISW